LQVVSVDWSMLAARRREPSCRRSLDALRIGPEIDPGVPALIADGSKPLALALKSGNFGNVDFFEKALKTLRSASNLE
jgi:Nucleotide-binding C-terminal domain